MQLRWVHELLVLEMSTSAENRSFESDMFLVSGAVLGCSIVGAGVRVEHKGCLVAVSWVPQGLQPCVSRMGAGLVSGCGMM